MSFVNVSNIISKQVLNETTGELETQEFKQEKKRTGLKGGFRMTYLDYDAAVIDVITSKLDLEIVVGIREMYSKKQTEVALKKGELALRYNTSENTIAKIIARCVTEGLLLRVSRGIYRFNPYMYLPYMANGAELQQEWNELCRNKVADILDEVDEEPIDRGPMTLDVVATLGDHGFSRMIAAGLKASMSMAEKWVIYDKVKGK